MKKWFRAKPFLAVLLPFFLWACAGPSIRAAPGAGKTIAGVPFFPQEKYQCGPASLAGVLQYWGVNDSPETIAAAIYSPGAKGTLDWDMGLYAQKRGLRARQYRGSLDDLKEKIDAGRPLVVLVDEGIWVYEKGHFMVAVGYAGEGIIANSGKDRHLFIPFEKFLRSWEKTKFWTLLVTRE